MRTEVSVGSHMTKYPVIATRDLTVSSALRRMAQFEIRHLPVVENNQIQGIVSERDLVRAGASINSTESADLLVGDVMRGNPYIAGLKTPLAEVTRRMASGKYGSVVIIDGAKEVMGIFTTVDALRILTSLLEKEESEVEANALRTMEDYFGWEWDTAFGE